MNPKERGKDRQSSDGRYYPGTWLKENHQKSRLGFRPRFKTETSKHEAETVHAPPSCMAAIFHKVTKTKESFTSVQYSNLFICRQGQIGVESRRSIIGRGLNISVYYHVRIVKEGRRVRAGSCDGSKAAET